MERQQYHFPFESYPAIRVVLLFAAGIILSQFLQLSFQLAALIGIGFILSAGALQYANSKLLNPKLSPLIILLYLMAIISTGMFRAVSDSPADFPEREFLAPLQSDTLWISGTVQETGISAGGHPNFYLMVESVALSQDGEALPMEFRTRVWYFRSRNWSVAPKPGSRVQVPAFPAIPNPPRNPHDFDYRSWLETQGISVEARGAAELIVLEPPRQMNPDFIRYRVRETVEGMFTDSRAHLASAIMLGYKAGLSPEDRQAFSRTGLAHLLAVSGMHVGFLLLPLWFALPYFWGSKRGKLAGLFLIFSVLLTYAAVTGFSASVQRASLFAAAIAVARLYHKQRDPINLTGFAALVMLIINPGALFDLGFQMSFTAVLTIFLTLPVLQRMFPNKIRHTWYAKTIMLIILSAFIQLAMYPLLALHFQEFSITGPIMNTLAVPITQTLFLWAFACLGFEALMPGVGAFLNAPADFMLYVLNALVNYAASFSWSYLNVPVPSPTLFFVWIAFWLFVASVFKEALRWKMLILLLITIVAHQGYRISVHFQEPHVKVTFFDVGQGDAVLIQTPGGKNILYDTGIITPFGNSGDRVLMPHFKAEGIDRIHAVILSHPHADHIGGLLELIGRIEIDVIYDSGLSYHSAIFSGYRHAARQRQIEINDVEMGDVLEIDPLTPMLVKGPHPGVTSSNPNEHSVVLKMLFGETSLLLTGDAETQAERLIAEQFGDMLDSDLLKAGHHGSRTSSHPWFLEEVDPQKIVVSLAKRNRYSHPHPEAVRNMKDTGARVKFTSLEGAVKFRMYQDRVERVNWRE